MLAVGDGHEIRREVRRNPDGRPGLMLYCGPVPAPSPLLRASSILHAGGSRSSTSAAAAGAARRGPRRCSKPSPPLATPAPTADVGFAA
jgi:hypothetical protein